VLLGSLIHDLAILRPLVGDPRDIGWARLWPAGWHPERLSVGVDAELAGGAQLALRWHYLPDYPSYTETVRVHTETGSYGLTFPAPYLLNAPTELTVTSARGGTVELTTSTSLRGGLRGAAGGLARRRDRGRPPAIGIDEARAEVSTCQRIAAAWPAALGLPVGGEALGAGLAVS